MHSSPDWPWFWDRNLTQRVSPMEVPLLRAGNYTAIYTTYHRSHDLHCLYCWRKVSHALQNGFKMMDARCHQFYHAKHCAMHIGETLIRKEEDEVLEKWAYPLMYHDCVPLTSTDES
ncbi:hypothetical protein NKR23_g6594 [Pleurostoma richardsiae]|uniref:Uncharacterized protein n=1 Tax=Pleurostoma richardsiae TaxID=41990 RepID=A0AA38RQC1_9PEZI|nr:hypothetical protein NKR23_g6594 [Pleurostoma richardsiae]